MPSPQLPSDSTSTRGFRPDQFQRKSTLRDYAIYAVILAVLGALIGVPLYYFTRSRTDQDRLRAKFGPMAGPLAGGAEKSAAQAAGAPQTKPATAPSVSRPEPTPATGSVSVYGGGTKSVVLRSPDPKAPEASAEFTQFVEALKVGGAVQGNPARAILNGKSFRAGESIDATLGVTFAGLGVAEGRKFLLLRDPSGAELRLTY